MASALPLAIFKNATFARLHREMDVDVIEDLNFTPASNEDLCPPRITLLIYIVIECTELDAKQIPSKITRRDYARQLLVSYPQLGLLLDDCWKQQEFKRIRLLGLFPLLFSHIRSDHPL